MINNANLEQNADNKTDCGPNKYFTSNFFLNILILD